MSRPRRNRIQTQVREPSQAWNDAVSLVVILGSIVHLLALVTFTPDDLPTWVSFSSSATPNDPRVNMIGPFGALLAGYSYFVFGAATYLIPAGLMWFGVMKLILRRSVPVREMAGFLVVLVSGACLVQFQPWFFQDWMVRYNTLGPGGCLGYGLGERMLVQVIGRGGAVLVCGFAYVIGMVLITGLHPLHLLHLLKRSFNEFRSAREARIEARERMAATGASVSDPPARRVAARRRRASPTDVEPESDGAGDVTTAGGFPEPELPLAIPAAEPKIIDSSVRRSSARDEKKPSLAEIRARRFGRERQRSGSDGGGDARGGRGSAGSLSSQLTEAFKDYELPDVELLDFGDTDAAEPADRSSLIEAQNTIIRTLATFGITVSPGDITRGPTITRYEIYPSEGLRVNRIVNLEADLARATKAERINIIAPIPGKDTVGIEIANRDKIAVPLRELLEDEVFANSKARIPLALGKDVYGNTIVADLAQMPHLLVAGATGAGKSVCINSIIASLLFQFTPDQLRFIMIDPKVVEMQNYNSLPHLVIPVVTDPKKVILALRWVVNEMERRYKVFAQVGVRNFDAFNKRDRAEAKAGRIVAGRAGATGRGGEREPRRSAASARAGSGSRGGGVALEDGDDAAEMDSPDPVRALEELEKCAVRIERASSGRRRGDHDDFEQEYEDEDDEDDALLEAEEDEDEFVADGLPVPDSYPYIVVIVDELADLMQTAPADVELLIARITQMARAAGIHLIVATQTPRADVITGVIKANIPSRIAFQVASALDSRVILDSKGAEKLVGKGDMLYLPPGTSQLVRAQGAFLSDEEIFALVQACSNQASPVFAADAQTAIEGSPGEDADAENLTDEDEEILEKCLDVIAQEKKASTSLLQRRLRLGYTRAARMIDILEARGIIGPGDGAKPREILVDLEEGPGAAP